MDIRLVKETLRADLVAKVRRARPQQGYHLVEDEPTDSERATHGKIAAIAVSETPTNAFRTSPLDPQAKRIAAGITSAFGAPPVQLRTLGGTVPIAPFIEALGFPAVLVPIVNFDNNQHEENENLRLGHLFQAIEIIAAILEELRGNVRLRTFNRWPPSTSTATSANPSVRIGSGPMPR